MAQNRVCKACLLRDLADADMSMIEKYKDAIKPVDRVDADEYEGRLQVCKACDKLNAGTCLACGCYVEIRAIAKVGSCPKKYW
ncbi:MAG: DUF6171 family protein [Pseudobutyrivibrio sp.]|nr:DUF6171 family protein [Pseudobutyrivibrio sp.]